MLKKLSDLRFSVNQLLHIKTLVERFIDYSGNDVSKWLIPEFHAIAAKVESSVFQ